MARENRQNLWRICGKAFAQRSVRDEHVSLHATETENSADGDPREIGSEGKDSLMLEVQPNRFLNLLSNPKLYTRKEEIMEEMQTDENDPVDSFCLICCNEIDPRTRTQGFQSANILDDIFFVLSNYMKWSETGRQFQFEFELFPFCDNCIPTVQSVYELNKQVHNLLKRIDQLCANVSANIVLSQNKCEWILKSKNSEIRKSTRRVKERDKSSCQFDEKKVCSYRDVILKRFTTSVKLSSTEKSVADEQAKKSENNRGQRALRVGTRQRGKRNIGEEESDAELLNELSPECSDLGEEDIGESWDDPDFDVEEVKDEVESDVDVEDETVGSEVNATGTTVGWSGPKESVKYASKHREFGKMNPHFWRHAGRVRQIDPTHFIFDEKFPFEYMSGVWKCGTCGQVFQRKQSMDTHLMGSCLKMNKRFKLQKLPNNKFKYGSHVFQKLGRDRFKCGDCDHVAETQVKVIGHIRTAHFYLKGKNRDYNIIQLGGNRYQYGDHQFENAENGLLRCLTCGNYCRQQSSMVEHINGYHLRPNKRLQRRHYNGLEKIGPSLYRYGGRYEASELEEDKFECLECHGVHHGRKAITSHLRNHLDKGKFPCRVCGLGLSRNYARIQHERLHSIEKTHHCHLCKKTFWGMKSLDKHLKNVHHDTVREPIESHSSGFGDEHTGKSERPESEKNLASFLCDEDSQRNSDRANDAGTVGESDPRSEQVVRAVENACNDSRTISVEKETGNHCDPRGSEESGDEFEGEGESGECGKDSNSRGKTKSVCRSKDKVVEGEKPNETPEEARLIETNGSQEQVSMNKEVCRRGPRNIKLAEVGISQFQYGDKHRFEAVHSSLFKCLTCGRYVRQKESMLNHIYSTHIKQTPEEPRTFTCFVEIKPNLFAYGKYKARKKQGDMYECLACHSVRPGRRSIIDHLRSHLNENKHSCNFCGKGFARKQHLQVHQQRMHTDKKPFQCELCSLKFVREISLRNHSRRVHQVSPSEVSRDPPISSESQPVVSDLSESTKEAIFAKVDCSKENDEKPDDTGDPSDGGISSAICQDFVNVDGDLNADLDSDQVRIEVDDEITNIAISEKEIEGKDAKTGKSILHYSEGCKDPAQRDVVIEENVSCDEKEDRPAKVKHCGGGETEDYSLSSASSVSGEESDQELSGNDYSCSSEDSESCDSNDEFETGLQKKTKKVKNVRPWKLARRVREIDSTHFIFDEKFPFEKVADDAWECGTCGILYRSKKHLGNHLLSSCMESQNRFTLKQLPDSKFQYAGRIFQKLKEDQFKCAECPHVSDTQEKAMGHVRNQHMYHPGLAMGFKELPNNKFKFAGFIFEKLGDQFKCEECSHLSESQDEAIIHAQGVHVYGLPRDSKLEVTELEENRFRYGDKYEFHLLENGLFKCASCGKRSRLPRNMLVHIIGHHIVRNNHHTNLHFKLVEIGPDSYLYANKYKVIKQEDGKYLCCECYSVCGGRNTLMSHVRKHYVKDLQKHTRHRRKPFQTDTDEIKSNARVKVNKEKQPDSSSGPMELPAFEDLIDKSVGAGFSSGVNYNPEIDNVQLEVEVSGEADRHQLGCENVDRHPEEAKSTVQDGDDYRPSSSESSDDSDLSSECDDAKTNSKKMGRTFRDGRTGRKLRPYDGKLVDRVRQIDATHFVYGEEYPFQRNLDGTWSCETCGMVFKLKRSIEGHLVSSCVRAARYKLETLSGDKFKYVGHGFQKLGENQFKCDVCQDLSPTLEKAMGHIRMRHATRDPKNGRITELPSNRFKYLGYIFEKCGDNQYKCADCPEVYDTLNQATGHIRSYHVYGPARVANLEVLEVAPNRFRYGDTHEFEVVSDHLFKCITCGNYCPTRKGIKQHILYFHIRGKKVAMAFHKMTELSPNEFIYADKYRVTKRGEEFECQECLFVTTSRMNIMHHLRYRHLNAGRFKCTTCGVGFPGKYYLREHELKHKNEVSCVCETCGATFVNNTSLQAHIYNKHKTKKHGCTFCAKVYSVPGQLKLHMRVHTGILVDPVVCEVCGKTVERYRLSQHNASHERKYSCAPCRKTFVNKSTLEAHIRAHAGEKPYKCELCDKVYASKDGLKWHQHRHHSEYTAEYKKTFRKRLRKPGTGPHPCDICGKGFWDKRRIKEHKVRYHSELTPELDRQLKEKLCRKRKTAPVESDNQYSSTDDDSSIQMDLASV